MATSMLELPFAVLVHDLLRCAKSQGPTHIPLYVHNFIIKEHGFIRKYIYANTRLQCAFMQYKIEVIKP